MTRRAPSQDPGVTKDSIKIGGIYPFSGPASAYGDIATGAKAYFDMVNDKGGVDGRKIEFTTVDDGYEPPKAVQASRKLVEQDKVFALFNTLGTPSNLAIWDYTNQEKVPQVYVATGASEFGADIKKHPYTTGWQPNYVTEAKIYADYLKKEKPNAKVGMLLQNDGFGKDLSGGFEEALKGSDVKVVAKETLRGHRPQRGVAGQEAVDLGGGHVPERDHAEVLGPGDRGRGQVGLEAAAHPEQRGRVEDQRAGAGRAGERQGHRVDGVLQGPRGSRVGRRRGHEGVQGAAQEVGSQGQPERAVQRVRLGAPRPP